jgi:hypothetical protein
MEVKPGKYKHYKGREYEVIETVIHSETLEKMVLYKPLYHAKDEFEGKMWVRPANMFTEMVEFEGRKVLRFVRII